MSTKFTRRTVIITFIVVAFISLIFVISKPKTDKLVKIEEYDSYQTFSKNDKTYEYKSGIKNILLVGVDGKDDDSLGGQADFISLLVLNEKEGKGELILIPRDTMTTINVCDSSGLVLDTNTTHINLAYPYGGNSHYYMSINIKNAVSKLFLDIPITSYMTMPLTILNDIIDIYGEGDVLLKDNSLSYIDESLVEGSYYHIDKQSVEKYIRSRDIEIDFSAKERTSRHKVFLEFIRDKLFNRTENQRKDDYNHLGDLLSKCETNITTRQLQIYYDLVLDNIEVANDVVVIPGEYKVGSFYDEFHYDEDELEELILDLFYTEVK